MSTLKTPFRYDFVGSFLRPEKLKAAKKAFEEGTITKEELDRITDECVTEIVAKQKAPVTLTKKPPPFTPIAVFSPVAKK